MWRCNDGARRWQTENGNSVKMNGNFLPTGFNRKFSFNPCVPFAFQLVKSKLWLNGKCPWSSIQHLPFVYVVLGQKKARTTIKELLWANSSIPSVSATHFRHATTCPGLLKERLIFVFMSCWGCGTIWLSWHYNFNGQITSDHQKRIHKWTGKTCQTFLHRISSFHFAQNPCWLGWKPQPWAAFNTALSVTKIKT